MSSSFFWTFKNINLLSFILFQTADGKAPALRVFTVCCASAGVSTESISLQGDCQRVLSGRFMALWLLGSGAQPRKDGSPSWRKWATAGPTADSSPICNFLCFIYLLRNDPASKPRGLVYTSIVRKGAKKKKEKKNWLTRLSFPRWPFVKVAHSRNFGCKVFTSRLSWMPLNASPFNTNKCLCHSCPLWHEHRHIFHLPAQLLAPHHQHHHHPRFNQSNATSTPATLHGPRLDNNTKWDYTQTYSGTRG